MVALFSRIFFQRTALAAVLLGEVLCTYWYSVYVSTASYRDGYKMAKEPPFQKCLARSVIHSCRERQLIKTLFVVDAQPEHITERSVARVTYAKPSFAGKMGWLTVFRLVVNTSEYPDQSLLDWMAYECESSGDIVYQDVTAGESSREDASSFLRFMPWVHKNCPSADTVVHMEVRVLPVPSKLERYRRAHMNSAKEVVHCFHPGNTTTTCTPSSAMMVKGAGLEALAKNAAGLDGGIEMEELSVANVASAVALQGDYTANTTFPEALFHVFPQLEGAPLLDMVFLWKKLKKRKKMIA